MPVFEAIDHETPEEDLDALRTLADDAHSYWCEVNPHEDPEAVEIGTWMGRTALVLARTFNKVYCVDTWEGNPGDRLGEIANKAGGRIMLQRKFMENMGDRLYRDIIPCPGPSWLYAEVWPRKVAMVFIDGNHDYNAVCGDILRWRLHVIPGGLICGHDYNVFDGVTKAVNELIPKDELETAGRCIWWTTAR